jgi:hypothetical protein
MATPTDNLNPPPAPQRVYYSTGRMLGVSDFQADQDYHRARLARALLQLFGTGTITGLNVVIAPSAWKPNTTYAQYAYVYDSGNNLQVNTGAAGTSGLTAPIFAAAGKTVNDANGIVWTNEGPIIPTGWQQGKTFQFPSAIVDPNQNIQILNVQPNLSTGTDPPPVWNQTIGGPTAEAANPTVWTCVGPMQIVVAVTAGLAIDRVGRLIDVPRTVCILLNNWLAQQIASWQAQIANPQPGQTPIPDPNLAVYNGTTLVCDVFATFVPCTRGLTPCFATEDDYDATDAFSPNQWLDSFAMQLVLRTDGTPPLPPPTPADPWKPSGPLVASGSGLTAANETTLQNLLLGAMAGPTAKPVEYPPLFDTSSVFLARIKIAATTGASGQPPVFNLAQVSIDNNSRLFIYPAGLLARLIGLGAGTET